MQNKTIYGLIGKSLSHSFSKQFFTEKFEKEGIDANYKNFELNKISEINDLLDKNENIKGLNITIPYKEEVIPFLDDLDGVAREIGAVNTIAVKNGKKIGYNTDVFGFSQSIKPFLENSHEKAIILGTGGASKAIEYVLKELGIEIIFLSRKPEKENEFSYDEANEIMLKHRKLIINCTPIGTYPKVDEMPKLPVEYITKNHFVIDLIYNPQETTLLRMARENGAITLNGLSMLKHQALKSWEIWQE